MKSYLRLIPVLFLLLGFGCCSDPSNWFCVSGAYSPPVSSTTVPEVLRNTQFNHKTVVNLRMGMPLPEFVSIFGPPDRSTGNTLESKAVSALRNMVYEYDMGKHADAHYPEVFGVNKIYFNVEVDPPVVERWDLDYVY